MSDTLLVIGCGKMGSALLEGFLQSENPPAVTIIEPHNGNALAQQFNCQVLPSIEAIETPASFSMVLLGVKPQMADDIMPTLTGLCQDDTLFLSILAGKEINYFKQYLSCPILRLMPNLPVTVGSGVTAATPSTALTDQQRTRLETLFAATGRFIWLDDETQMDAVTAISGSGPAYIFHMIEALEQAALSLGLPQKAASTLALATVTGSAKLAETNNDSPTILRQNVTSKGGTTAAALKVLMAEDGLGALMKKATQAASDRAKEL